MNVLVEHNELVLRALAYIFDRLGADAAGALSERHRARLVSLCDEAAMRFNLSPRDAEALSRALDRDSVCSEQRDAAEQSDPQDSHA